MKYINALLILLSAIGGVACIGEPEFALEPHIKFKSIARAAGGPSIDSVFITVEFEDGDGDLGLSNEDVGGLYAEYIVDEVTGDTIPNEFYYNYFIKVFKKGEDSIYQEVAFLDGQDFNGRYPLLNNSDRARPLQGELTYTLTLFVDNEQQVWNSPITEGDSLQFRVRIADRSLNLSNEITTEGIKVLSEEDVQE
ncbi:hypothetical protein [Algivirga pacifica]|uniref:Uncharacterized protein n=1 Tax=Algivirga pacifica TaxID=1162670 RepID=A0ABP9DJF4_9BACT